jgi:hypothetical protein
MTTKILVSTTQRCGSTWLASMCYRIKGEFVAEYVGALDYGLADAEPPAGDRLIEGVARFSDSIKKFPGSVFKTHDLPPALSPVFLEMNPDFHVVNVVRDFRDVLISRLFYNRYFLAAALRPCESPFVDRNRLLSDQTLVQKFLRTDEMETWLEDWLRFNRSVGHRRYQTFRYEELFTEGGLTRALSDLAERLGVAEPDFDDVKKRVAFENVPENEHKTRGSREVRSDFCRKGVVGDHKNFMTEQETAELATRMNDPYYT